MQDLRAGYTHDVKTALFITVHYCCLFVFQRKSCVLTNILEELSEAC